MKNHPLAYLLLFCAGCGVPETKDPSPAAAAELEKARQHLAADDPDAALLITDRLLNQNGADRAARLLAAEANLALVGRGDRGLLTQAFLEDAARHYDRALALDADDATSWMNLSRTARMLGRFERGRDAALQAAELHRRDGAKDELGEALVLAADNEMRIFVAARRQELQGEEKSVQEKTARLATVVLSRLEAAKASQPGPSYLQAAQVYAWLNQPGKELAELERGIGADPGHFPLHTRYRQLRIQRDQQRQCVATYRALLRDEGPNAALYFALGMAESAAADKSRKDGDREAAQGACLAAIKSFTNCMNNRPTWRDNCLHWIAVEHIALARMHQEAGEIAAGKAQLKKAFASTPKVLQWSEERRPLVVDSFGAYYEGTLSALGKSVAAPNTREALTDALAFWEEFIALHPKQLGWLYNNAAFVARDLGVAMETAAKNSDDAGKRKAATKAMAIFERSYELYKAAVELSPENARTINDCGLMLIYHLHRDYSDADRLFDRAIEVGLAELRGMDENTPAADRQFLEEAIGDAYQNKAKMSRDLGVNFAVYEPSLREAVKYYPYQRRDAARWLRAGKNQVRSGTTKPGLPKVDPRLAAFKGTAEAALRKANVKDYDGALLVLDGVAKDMSGLAPYHYYVGLYSLRYAQQSVANGGSAGLIDGLYADARNNLQKSVDLDSDPVEPRLYLALANLDSGEFVNAAKISAELLLHIAAAGGTTEDLLAETQAIRARAGTRVYVADKQRKVDNEVELQGARNAFRSLEKMQRLDKGLRGNWSMLEQWAGDKQAALAIYQRAVEKTPDDQALLGEFVDAASKTRLSTRAAETLAGRTDALGLFYLGWSRYYAALEVPAGEKGRAAIAGLGRAIESFKASAQKNPAYENSCRTWRASCRGNQGFFALDNQDFTAAEAHFLAAAKLDPSRFGASISNNRSVKTGIEWIVYHHSQKKNDLPAAIQTLEKTCAVIRNDATLSNNLGLFARDHGSSLERAGDRNAAMPFYEKSVTAYQNAVRLESTSVRQRNDLVVVQIYNLRRDLDKARKMLIEAIADGERQLAEDAPEDRLELRDLRESIGDCYQNMGYYLMSFAKDLPGARKNLEKSVTFYPFKQRASSRMLQQLERLEKKDK